MTEREGLAFRNPVKQAGWAQVYHVLTLDRDLSDGAFRLYVLLLRYARQEHGCWPGRERLAQDLDKSVRTIDRHLSALVERGLITREQRLHQTAMTWIEDVERVYNPIPAIFVRDIPVRNGKDLSLSKTAGEEETEEEADRNGGGASTTQQASALSLLLSIRVTESVARSLAHRCSPATIQRWVAYARHARGLHNPAAFVVSKLRAGEDPPTNGTDPADDRRRYLEWIGR